MEHLRRPARRSGSSIRGLSQSRGSRRAQVGVRGLEGALTLTTRSLVATLDGVARLAGDAATDPFRRVFDGRSVLELPFFGAKVTGALFHTQGGLVIDAMAQVLRVDGTALPNLFAGDGAAFQVPTWMTISLATDYSQL